MNNIPGRIGPLVLAALLANPAMAIDAPRPPQIAVAAEPGAKPAVTLEARDAPLARVLDELAARTGAVIHYSVLPEAPVTATCAGASLQPVLRCLLGAKADFLLRAGGSAQSAKAGQPREIWILGSSLIKERSAAGDAAVCTAAAGAPKEPGKKPNAEESRRKREQAEQVVALAGGSDPVARAAALDRLSGENLADATTVRQILEKSLTDQEPEVRAKAVWGLARRGGPQSAAVLQTALHAPDLSVRLMAVDAAGADADGLALLEQAAGDGDEAVSSIATQKLQELKNLPRQP
ncbi:MAG: HEAT repeat domain-containing protein [Methylococcaceae bacterium]|nr:HEAT repeat domain-containing protein [Methylococcaceae bacterium]